MAAGVGGVLVRLRLSACLTAFFVGLHVVAAAAAECPGRPDALGTARVLTLDPLAHQRVGRMQYPTSLPLADKEVVLTFDDGPLPAYTAGVLRALADECVRATFFMVGRMARAYPEWVRRVYNAGHTVATHSDRHPRRFDLLGEDQGHEEIERGIIAAAEALGDARALAPFFRFPGLRRSDAMEDHLAERGISIWSADIPGDDWRPITSDAVTARVLDRLERKGRGILLLHDIQKRTALALPNLLRQLKERGYRIVHVVPSGSDRPPNVPEPETRVARSQSRGIWPIPRASHVAMRPPELGVPSPLSFGFPHVLAAELMIGAVDESAAPMRIERSVLPLPGQSGKRASPVAWPRPAVIITGAASPYQIAVPSDRSLDLSHPLSLHPVAKVAEEVEPRPATHRRPRRPQAVKRRPLRAAPEPSDERLRGRIEEGTGERHWARQLNWFQ